MTKRTKKEPQAQIQGSQFANNEVERRIYATLAIRDVEIEHLLTGVRLLRSNFNNEQLQTPVFQFFKEYMPNLTAKVNEKDGLFDVDWNNDDHLSISRTDERKLHLSLLERISKAYPECAGGVPLTRGFGHSMSFDHLGAANFQIPDYVMEQPPDSQMFALQESFQTPGGNSQRLSVGTTPKCLRQPKHGEMLLSVHGSPLGMYKEDNMEPIRELFKDPMARGKAPMQEEDDPEER